LAIIDMLDAGKNRHAISVATGVQYHTVVSIAKRIQLEREARKNDVDAAKREYCGPYLLALPPPAWWVPYVPAVPPYRMFFLDGGKRSFCRIYQSKREAISDIMTMELCPGQSAELLDANDDWIARVGRPLPSQGYPRSP
jgi:hypothetical protein